MAPALTSASRLPLRLASWFPRFRPEGSFLLAQDQGPDSADLVRRATPDLSAPLENDSEFRYQDGQASTSDVTDPSAPPAPSTQLEAHGRQARRHEPDQGLLHDESERQGRTRDSRDGVVAAAPDRDRPRQEGSNVFGQRVPLPFNRAPLSRPILKGAHGSMPRQLCASGLRTIVAHTMQRHPRQAETHSFGTRLR